MSLTLADVLVHCQLEIDGWRKALAELDRQPVSITRELKRMTIRRELDRYATALKVIDEVLP